MSQIQGSEGMCLPFVNVSAEFPAPSRLGDRQSLAAVLTVLLTLVGERRQELATVRALGGSRRQLLTMVVAEAGLLGIAAAAADASPPP